MLGYIVTVTRQIAVRLDEELVRFVDEEVAEGRARSRADLLSRAIQRERRRRRAEQDVRILTATGRDPDLEAVARSAADTPLDLD